MQRKEMCNELNRFLTTYPVSQTELAKAADVSINTINEIVMGRKPETKLQSKTVVKIKEAMKKWEK